MRRIRQASKDDRATIEAIVRSAYAHYTERIGKPAGPIFADYRRLIEAERVWVLTEGNGVLGVLVVVIDAGRALLDNVAVAPSAQGRGLGRALIAHAERQAAASGLDALELYTNAAMSENIAKYSRLGYVEFHRATVDGYDRVYMRKELRVRRRSGGGRSGREEA